MTDKTKTKELFEHLGITYTHKVNEHKHLVGWEHIETVLTIRPSLRVSPHLCRKTNRTSY